MIGVVLLIAILLSAIMLCVVLQCQYDKCRYAECLYAWCCFVECRGTNDFMTLGHFIKIKADTETLESNHRHIK
jgi:hypothetical protein